jgi:soluble lytic murein transglycosylase-like protein/TolA-binding protein
MIFRLFRRFGVSIFILLFLAFGHAKVCFGGFLAEDSARFAAYWNLIESGDMRAAQDTLMSIGSEGPGCTEQMANFLLAWQTAAGGDYSGVSALLDLGVPPELTDHARWLQADALVRAGQEALAEAHWKEIAADTGSVYCADALYQLVDHAFEAGSLDECLTYAEEFSHRKADIDDRQHVEFLQAQTLAVMKRHEEAVDALWAAYDLAPFTGEATRIHAMLDGYQRRYRFSARSQTPEELGAEYGAIEQAKQFSLGLERVERELRGKLPQSEEEVLRYFRGRFQNGLSRHSACIASLQDYADRYPTSRFRFKALYYLGRSAYLTDRDEMAIPALTEAGHQREDLDIAQKSLDLLGTLHLDRNRPGDAVAAWTEWDSLSRGTDAEQDCLWKLGRGLWEAGHYNEAAATWNRLYAMDANSDYAPAVLYWSGRAAEKAGHKPAAEYRYRLLLSRFPYSYNAIVARAKPDSVVIEDHPLTAPSLDELWETGGPHCRKFAMLTALRLTNPALRELPAAKQEWVDVAGLSWWKAQHLLWQGKRMAAWRVVLTELGIYLRTAGARPSAFTAIAYPLDFDPQVVQLASQYGLDPYFIFGLICQESHFEEGIVSPAGATGLMQLMPKTAWHESKRMGIGYATRKLRNPDYNLRVGIAHLARLFSDFGGDSVLVLAAYNAGPNAASAWQAEFGNRDRDEFIENIPYRETRMYVKRIVEHAAAYRRLYPDIVNTLRLEEQQETPSDSGSANGLHKR